MPLIERLSARGKVKLIVACDADGQKAHQAQARFAIPRLARDYQAVVTADDVDLVLVLTAMPAHGPITWAALEAGKHVLVEKPMAVTLPEARELLALAKRSTGHLVCAPHIILSNTYQTMWRSIAAGDIGKPLSARALYGWAGPAWTPWFYRRGGGSLFDLGVYNITSLTGIFGPARRITALAGVAIPERVIGDERVAVEADDNVHLLMDFGDNVYASVATGFTIQKYRCAGLEIYGSAGTIQMLGEDWAPKGYELWQNSAGCWQLYENTDPTWTWPDGLRHLVECIQEGTRPIIQPEHAFHVLEIMIKAQESGRDGQARAIESTFAPLAIGHGEAAGPAHLVHDPGRQE